MPTLFGTCPKCEVSYELNGDCDMAGVICPNCKEKGVTMPGVIHLEPKKLSLKEAAEALLKYIEENNVHDMSCDDGDGYVDMWCSPEFEAAILKLKKALE